MTSNIGAHIIQENFADINDSNKEGILQTTKIEVMELLKKSIRPEFLNRVDEIIMFTPLMRDEIKQIVSLQIEQLKTLLAKNNVNIDVTEDALELLSKNGFDPQYGARPLKRLVQKEIVNELSKRLLAGDVSRDKILIDADKGSIVFKNKKTKQPA